MQPMLKCQSWLTSGPQVKILNLVGKSLIVYIEL